MRLPALIVALWLGSLHAQPVESPVVRLVIPEHQLSQQELETVAACLILEAANQGEIGLRAVMGVIHNRAKGRSELFAPVVLRPRQFSSLNRVTGRQETLAGAIRRARRDRMWPVALRIVQEAATPHWEDPSDGATHFTRTGEGPAWVHRMRRVAIVGQHSFYR